MYGCSGAARHRGIRLVACDLDGTILGSDGRISARTSAAWRAAGAAGITMVILTARPPRYLGPVADALGCDGLAVCANGAISFDLASRCVVDARPLTRPVAGSVGAHVAEVAPGVGFAVETGTRVVHEPRFAKPDSGDLRFAAADLAEMWRRGAPIVKLLARSALSQADALLPVVRAAAGASAECTHSGGHGLVEVSAAGVSKVAALADLCRQRHRSRRGGRVRGHAEMTWPCCSGPVPATRWRMPMRACSARALR